MKKKIVKLTLLGLGIIILATTLAPISVFAKKPIVNVNKQDGKWQTNPQTGSLYIGYNKVNQSYGKDSKSWQLNCSGEGILDCALSNNISSSSTFTTPLNNTFYYNDFNNLFIELNEIMNKEVSKCNYKGTTTKKVLVKSIEGKYCNIVFELEWILDSNGNGTTTIYVDDYKI